MINVIAGTALYAKYNFQFRPWSIRIRWLIAFIGYPLVFTAVGFIYPTVSDSIAGLLCVLIPCFCCVAIGWYTHSIWVTGGDRIAGHTHYIAICETCKEPLSAEAVPNLVMAMRKHFYEHDVRSGLA